MSDIEDRMLDALILRGYRIRSQQLIAAGYTDLKSAINRMIAGTPGFAKCPVFREHFPICFLEVQELLRNSQGQVQ